jgi:sec-independent protein translocase protein TatB
MFGIDFPEVAIIFGLALVVLGPKKLPGAAAQVGRWLGRARAMARQFREQLEQEVHNVESALDTRSPNPAPSTTTQPNSAAATPNPAATTPDPAPFTSPEPESLGTPPGAQPFGFGNGAEHGASPLWTDPGVDHAVPPAAAPTATPEAPTAASESHGPTEPLEPVARTSHAPPHESHDAQE